MAAARRQVAAVRSRGLRPDLLVLAEHIDQRRRPAAGQPEVAIIRGVELKPNDGPHMDIVTDLISPRIGTYRAPHGRLSGTDRDGQP